MSRNYGLSVRLVAPPLLLHLEHPCPPLCRATPRLPSLTLCYHVSKFPTLAPRPLPTIGVVCDSENVASPASISPYAPRSSRCKKWRSRLDISVPICSHQSQRNHCSYKVMHASTHTCIYSASPDLLLSVLVSVSLPHSSFPLLCALKLIVMLRVVCQS